MTNVVIASKDVTVHDNAIGIDRKLFAGQPVPPDLVEAYSAEGGVVPDDYEPGEAQVQSRQPKDDEVIASRDVVVHDKAMGIDRKLLKGQLVPPDLVKAYGDETGEDVPEPSSDDETDYEKQSVGDLEDEVDRRRAAGRDIEVTGSGADGNVVKKDLVAALEADDAA